MRGRIILALGILPILISPSCVDTSYCDQLEAAARQPVTQAELRKWVATNLTGTRILASDVTSGEGFVPGLRWLEKSFDGELLGFGTHAHVRLVGPQAQDELDDTITENVESVLFTERSRTGILVRPSTSTTFGVDPRDLVYVDGDVAVLCYPGN